MNLAIAITIVVGMFLLLILVYRFMGSHTKQIARNPKYPIGVNVDKDSKQPMSNSESIGSISIRLGEDIREVWELGYSDEQINDVLTGKYTLAEMHKLEPQGNPKSTKGNAILDKKKQDSA